MNKFIEDNNWQKEIRNSILEPFYQKISYKNRFIFVDKGKLATKLQREMSIDTIIQLKNNGILGIEEKIVRWPGYNYKSYTLEIMSCTQPGFEKQGWMYYALCDYLFYCFVQEDGKSVIIHILPFTNLKDWFFEDDRFKNYRSSISNQFNKTEVKIVPIADVLRDVSNCQVILANLNGYEKIDIDFFI
ncbi:MAG TPA: hypothetical protein PK723_05680 [Candidatus Pacearchaeota archaeon]|nr:hypothetical protein [Candidatus Pacearchaeota archaeon]